MQMNSLVNQFLIAMPTLSDGLFDKTVTYICEHDDEGAMGLIINSPLNISLIELLKKVDFTTMPCPPVKHTKDSAGETISKNETNPLLKNLSSQEVSSSPLSKLEVLLAKASQQDKDSTAPNDNEATQPYTDNITLLDSSNITSDLEQMVLLGGPLEQERGFVLHTTQQGWQNSLVISEHLMITSSKDILLALGTDKAPKLFIIALGHANWGPGQLEEEIQANLWLTTDADNDIIFNTPIEERWHKANESLGIDIAHLSNDVGHA